MKKRVFAMVTALLLLVLLPVMPGAAQEEPKDTWVLAINATFPPFESIADSTDEYVGLISTLPIISQRNWESIWKFTICSFPPWFPPCRAEERI